MSIEAWESYFKPEARNAGNTLHSKGAVHFSRGSDTEVHLFIRGSSPIKVSFKSDSIESPLMIANCTCPQSKKGQLCKHMWAALTEVDIKNPDFLENKHQLENGVDPHFTNSTENAAPLSESQQAQKEKRAQYEAAQKEKQSQYRKQQYQKQKAKMDLKKGKAPKSKAIVEEFPEDIEAALVYFSENGFELREALSTDAISLARKQLARIFHPDKGGSHDEILELNMHTETLLSFVEN